MREGKAGIRILAVFLILLPVLFRPVHALALFVVSRQAHGAVSGGGWRPALPGYRFRFPRDHASHPAFRTEWWYYTGHLRAANGSPFGFELTFFRFGMRPPRAGGRSAWTLRNLYAAHFAVTDEAENRFYFLDRLSRGALGTAGANTGRFRVWLDDWSASAQLPNYSNVLAWPSNRGMSLGSDGAALDPPHPAPRSQTETHRLHATGGGYSLDLALRPAKPPAVHGSGGVSQKSAGLGHASHYYSLTRLLGNGALTTPRGRFRVDGLAWMDHEFGSNQLGADQVGWDWFSLQLADGRELMLYQLRQRNGHRDPFSSGTLVGRDGATRHLSLAEFSVTVRKHWRSAKTGALYPASWEVRVPSARLAVTLTPTVADQELVTTGSTGVAYWEGCVQIQGSARGQGYVEMTGYAQRFRTPI